MHKDTRDPALIRWWKKRRVVVCLPVSSSGAATNQKKNAFSHPLSLPSAPCQQKTKNPTPKSPPAATASWWNDRPLGQSNSSFPSSSSSSREEHLLTTPALLGGDAAWRPPPPLAFRDGTIVDSLSSAPVDLHGFNWAGFNYIQYGMEFFEGLHEGKDTATGDFATVVYRQQLLGFNLVRIPFRFASLFEEDDDEGEGKDAHYDDDDDEKEEEGEEKKKKSGLLLPGERLLARKRWRRPSRTLARRCRWTSRAALKKVLSNPTPPFYSRIDYDRIPLPKPVAPPAKPASYVNRKDAADSKGAKKKSFKNPPECNWYLPDTTILDRMLFAVQYYVANGENLERE